MKKYRLAILNTHPIQYFTPLYSHLAKETDIDLTVYFCSKQGAESYVDSGFKKEVKWDVPLLEGYRYKFLHNLRKKGTIGSFFSLINPGIIGELKNGHYDALLVHGQTPATVIIAILAAKIFGTKVFMRGETHLLLSRQPIKRWLRPLVMKLFYKICDAFLAIGTLNQEFYLAHGVSPEKIYLVPYAVDNKYFFSKVEKNKQQIFACKSKFNLLTETFVILYAGKLQPRKRPLDLLFAYEKLRARGINSQLVYVGSGEQEDLLRQTVITHNIPNVSFFGFRNQSELPEFFAVADVFVLPSVDEPWGLIINEAMCASLPIVASEEIGAVRDLLLNGKNGYTFPSGDIDKLTEALALVIQSPSKRRSMAEASRHIISNWGYEECVIGIRQALESFEKA